MAFFIPEPDEAGSFGPWPLCLGFQQGSMRGTGIALRGTACTTLGFMAAPTPAAATFDLKVFLARSANELELKTAPDLNEVVWARNTYS